MEEGRRHQAVLKGEEGSSQEGTNERCPGEERQQLQGKGHLGSGGWDLEVWAGADRASQRRCEWVDVGNRKVGSGRRR